MESFYLGGYAKVRLTITSSTASTTPVDPGALTAYLTEPDGATYSAAWGGSTLVTTQGAGQFTFTWPVAKRGIHRGGWLATASHGGADEFEFMAAERRY